MSEKTLDKLIASLKTEAVEAAEKEAQKIVEAANVEAQNILSKAAAQKTEILQNAEKEAKATLEKGEGLLRQAARDLNVTVQNDLLKLLKTVLSNKVTKTFTPDLVKSTVLKIIENADSSVEVKLSEDLKKELAGYIQQELQASKSLVSITKDNSILKGFTVTKTDQGWSYNITPDEVSEILNDHLSSKWVDILKNK
ncbi:hypothetical protein MHL31_07510 [Lutibacter sp. A80]|uniref:hypothetical protein n=1 Tax=Lutibacter sp. A80 TaxID=2918453 RepID=UPI001F069273|nr:hypothetical protein [Lutibacter sp. A80]UMB62031.1 hypothetical protein MHL31_07510 [Lutibacter sp. A80]